MRIVSFITERDVIDRILSHRGEFEERTHSPPEEEDQAVVIYSKELIKFYASHELAKLI